jgi:hypothetical protein
LGLLRHGILAARVERGQHVEADDIISLARSQWSGVFGLNCRHALVDHRMDLLLQSRRHGVVLPSADAFPRTTPDATPP